MGYVISASCSLAETCPAPHCRHQGPVVSIWCTFAICNLSSLHVDACRQSQARRGRSSGQCPQCRLSPLPSGPVLALSCSDNAYRIPHTQLINPNASAMSFFTRPDLRRSSASHTSHKSSRPAYSRAPSSNASFFSRNGGSSSYYKRRPRDGYVQSLVHKLKRLLRDLWEYARRHPLKAFMAVVVPLISAGGALQSLLKQFGIRLPVAFDGVSATPRGGYYGSSGYGGYGSSYASSFGRGDAMDTVGSLMKIARAFM